MRNCLKTNTKNSEPTAQYINNCNKTINSLTVMICKTWQTRSYASCINRHRKVCDTTGSTTKLC